MKKRTIIISSLICLSPILLGIFLWNILPEMLIRHFGPGHLSVSSKETVIFFYPFIFLILHLIVVFKPDWLNNIPRSEKRYWYVPIISIVFFLISFTMSLRT